MNDKIHFIRRRQVDKPDQPDQVLEEKHIFQGKYAVTTVRTASGLKYQVTMRHEGNTIMEGIYLVGPEGEKPKLLRLKGFNADEYCASSIRPYRDYIEKL